MHHLYRSRELLSYRLNTIHNLYYYLHLMQTMRAAILNDAFDAFKASFTPAAGIQENPGKINAFPEQVAIRPIYLMLFIVFNTDQQPFQLMIKQETS
ncbi:MAG: hypothetical protein R2875_00815 [Desulfobacterales bacterium]